MRILIPITSFLKSGGFRTLSEFATKWVEQGHSVDFVQTVNSAPYFPTKANIILIDCKGNEASKQCVECEKRGINRLKGLQSFIHNNSYKYDVVLGNYNLVALFAILGSPKRIFYYVQAYEPEFYPITSVKHFVFHFLAYLSYKLSSIKIVNAELYRNYKGLHSKYVIPPGLDLNIFYPKIYAWDKKRPLVIGCIGRSEEWKGSGDVAKAVSILQAKGANIYFKVAFNPVECEDYELVKPDGDENLSAYYRSLDVLVAPAKLQLGAIHYPVIEAMASGTTVITTGYYPANEDNSYIVPISNPEAIASVIEKIMNNYEEALEKINKAHKEIQRFSWDVVSRDFINIFERELDKK